MKRNTVFTSPAWILLGVTLMACGYYRLAGPLPIAISAGLLISLTSRSWTEMLRAVAWSLTGAALAIPFSSLPIIVVNGFAFKGDALLAVSQTGFSIAAEVHGIVLLSAIVGTFLKIAFLKTALRPRAFVDSSQKN